jgi:class 3 adenylate cyclase/CHASE2 domain-containing sensor protein
MTIAAIYTHPLGPNRDFRRSATHLMPRNRTRVLGRGTLVCGWLIALCLGMVFNALPGVGLLDLKLLDAAFARIREFRPIPVDDKIAIIGIDDATLEEFPEPIALWHPYLAGILRVLAEARPAAVGIDIELPERSYDFLREGGDRELAGAMLAIRAAAPLVIARGIDQAGRVKPIHSLFAAAAGEHGTGLANWPLDADGRVRRFDERLADSATPIPTFTGSIARALGKSPEPGIIDFSVGGPFTYVSAHTVFNWGKAGDEARLAQAFKDRVVLIGSVLPFVDRHAVPVALAGWEDDASSAPGILLHAQALRSILGPGLITQAPLVAALALTFVASFMWFTLGRISLGLGIMTLFISVVIAAALMLLARGVHLPIAAALITAGVASTARAGYDAWFNRRERERLKREFEGYVSPNVMELILRGDLDTDTGSGRRMLCVLFADIRNFTQMSAQTNPEAVVDVLNRYFERMTAAIHAEDGTVDNFRGDGIMCFFGAPRPTANPCKQGYRAARAMFEALDALNAELTGRGVAPINIGISLAYGEAIVGRVGAATRHEYTAIGDVANVAARLEAMTKVLGYPLLVSREVIDGIGASAEFDDLGVQELKGHAPVRVFGGPKRAVVPEARLLNTKEAHHG